jgi:hypothetical protein
MLKTGKSPMSLQPFLALPGALMAGVVLGALYLFLARRAGRMEIWLLAAGLIVAAAVYLVFALTGASSPREYRLEIIGMVIFTPMALGGARWWPPLVGLGWLLHGAWDVLLHWPAQAWLPGLYPVFCVSFDLVVAAYFLFLLGMRSMKPT